MALGAQLPIRLESEIEKRLEKAADNIGTTKSAIIRMLAKTFVEQCVSDDGKVHLPPQWQELLPSADRRSHAVVGLNIKRPEAKMINSSPVSEDEAVIKAAEAAPASRPVRRRR